MQARRIIPFVTSLLLISTMVLSQRTAQAEPAAQGGLCFPNIPQIQHCITGFRAYWQEHGGLPIFGYPISEERSELNADTGGTYTTQWFERNRFEAHPENQPPYHVLLGRLGVDRLGQLGRAWQNLPKAAESAPHYFAETGHAIAHGPFWRYWSSHGLEWDGRPGKSYQESLALFGLPISEPAMETNPSGDRVLTQWFERARFEDHGDQGVLLGLLGNEVRGRSTPEEPAAGLRYFWPGPSPMTVWEQGGSYADERGFALHLAMPHAGEPDVTITGGAAVSAPEGSGRSVNIRGQSGRAYVSATRMAVVWREGGQPYMITANLREPELLAFAAGLEALDLATCRARLQQPHQPSPGLQYLWPRSSSLAVWPTGSYADERSFVLQLAPPHATASDTIISGGAIAPPPEGQGTPVTVRGQRGALHSLGARLALSWTEGGQFYMITSPMAQGEIVALANDLEALDLATFRARLQAQEPSARLLYFWPAPEEHELSVLPEPHGGSFADETGFRLNLYRVHSRQPNITVTGGSAVRAPRERGSSTMVRGQQATAYTTGRGAALVWREAGHQYMVESDLRLPDMLQWTSTLDVIDLSAFRSRIRPE